MMKLFKGEYDAFLCCSLADEYLNGSSDDDELLNELMVQLAPLVGLVARSRISTEVPVESRDAVCVDAWQKAYELCKAGAVIPTDSVDSFTSFMKTTLYRAMIDSMRVSKVEVFDYGSVCIEPEYAQLPTHRQVEARIQLQQVRSIIKAVFDQDCKYVGTEGKACRFMARCLIGLVEQDPMSAQHRFKLTRARTKALLEYSRILVKSTVYSLKSSDESP